MSQYSIIVVLVLVQSIFGLWPVLVKNALAEGNKAAVLSMYRDLVASCILWLGVWVECGCPNVLHSVIPTVKLSSSSFSSSKQISLAVDKYWIFLLLGIASCINSLGFVLSLNYITPFNSALLHPAIPVFAIVFGSYLGVETISNRKLFGAFICIAGSIVVVLSQSNLQLSTSFVGNFLLLAQSIAMGCLLVGQKFVKDDYSSLRVTALYYSIGTAISIPVCLIMASINNDSIILSITSTTVESVSVMTVAFGAIFVVCLNYAALTWVTRVSSPAIPSSSMMLQPPLTYLISYLWGYDQTFGPWDALGVLFIIYGLILTIFSENDKLFAMFSILTGSNNFGYIDVKTSEDDMDHGDTRTSFVATDEEMELMIRSTDYTGLHSGSDSFQI